MAYRKFKIVIIALLAAVFPLTAIAAGAGKHQQSFFLAGADNNRVILRWAWPKGTIFAPQYRVYRRESGADSWVELTVKPITKVKSRERAKKVLGDSAYQKNVGLLFPQIPDYRKDPKKYQAVVKNLGALWGMTMLSADLNPKIADLLGIRYVDNTALNGTAYFYRLDMKGDGGWKVVGTVGPVNPGQKTIGAPPALQGKGGDKVAMLRWKREERFSGYEIYRSEKKGAKLHHLNKLPVVILKNRDKDGNIRYPEWIYADRSVENGKTYWYVVRGRDPFGRLSLPTIAISLKPRDLTAPMAPAEFTVHVRGDVVRMSWLKSPDKDLAGYYIYRSLDYKAGFKRVTAKPLPPDTLEYTDKSLPANKTFWYCVVAVDKAGNESARSYIAPANTRDIVPPAAPVKLEGKTEPGKVFLTWQANKEEDLAGYRVYLAMKQDEKYYHMLNQKPMLATSYLYELPKTASANPYFCKITAMDKSGNESESSAIIEVKLPDVTAPRSPVIKKVTNGEGKITVTWYPCSEPDVAGYSIFRHRKGGDKKKALQLNDTLLPPDSNKFIDKRDLQLGVKYLYFMKAVDREGNISIASRSSVGAIYDLTPPAAPKNLQVGFSRWKKAVVVTWKNPDASDFAGVLIYRAEKSEGPYRPASSLLQGKKLVDKKADRHHEYFYRAVAFDRVKNKSPFSKTVHYRPEN